MERTDEVDSIIIEDELLVLPWYQCIRTDGECLIVRLTEDDGKLEILSMTEMLEDDEECIYRDYFDEGDKPTESNLHYALDRIFISGHTIVGQAGSEEKLIESLSGLYRGWRKNLKQNGTLANHNMDIVKFIDGLLEDYPEYRI